MSGKNDIVAGIRLDGEKEFKTGVAGINKSLTAMKSELGLVTAQYEGQANSLEALSKKDEILNRILEEQKKKVDKTRQALQNATASYENADKKVNALKTVYDQQKNKLDELNRAYDEAKQRLAKMTQEGNSSERAMQKQKGTVEALKTAIDKQKTALDRATVKLDKGEAAYQKIGNKVQDWKNKLNTAESQVIKATRAVSQNAAYLKEAQEATDGCASSIDEFGKTLQETGKMTTDWGEKVKSALVTKGTSMAVDALKEGVVAVKESMYDLSGASAKLASSTGLSEASMKKYQTVMKEIKGNNFGEDYGDVADVMSEIVQIMGELDPSAMQETTESAIALRDTFGMDINEQIRAVDVMMKTMGVDARTAFDLIARGAQNGLNRSGELTDNITEYAQIWGQAGFSAEEMFAILENGLDAGAYNLDKVNDYVKEFGNSLADGRIEKNIGYFSDSTKNLFESWKNGEASTSDVFYSVINDLSEMTNQQEALTIASEVWSALGEDNAMQVLTALDDVNDAYKDVRGTMDSLKEVRYSDLESAVSGLGAAIQENLVTPIADAALPTITGLFQTATDVVNGIGEAVNQPKSDIEQFIDDIKSSNDEVQTLLNNASQALTAADTDVSKLEAYKRTILGLNELENASGLQKYELKQAVNDLAGDIPQLAQAWDDEKEKIDLSRDAIVDLIDQQIAYKEQTAATLALQETYNAKIAAEANKLKIDSSIEDLNERIDAMRKLNEASDGFQVGGYGEYYKELVKLEIDLEKLTKEQTEANKAAEDAAAQYNVLESHVEELTAAEEEAGEKVAGHADELDGLSTSADNAGEATSNLADKTEESYDRIEEAAKAGAEAQKEAMQNIRDAYDSAVSEIKSDLQNKISLFDKFDTEDSGQDMTVEEMTANLESQNQAFEEYSARLEAVKNHIGKEITPEFFQYLQEMGMEGDNTLKHILATFDEADPEAGAEKVRRLCEEWTESMDRTEEIAEVGAANRIAYEAAMGELGSSDADFSELSESIDTAVSSAAEGWADLPDATRVSMDKAVETARECGVKIPEGLAEGIVSGEISPEEAIAQLNGSVQGAFEGLAEVAKKVGIDDDIISELAAGIESGGQDAVDAISRLVEQISGKSPELKKAIEEGTKTDEVKSSVESTVDSGAEAITEAAQTYQENSKALGKAIVNGMQESSHDLRRAVEQIAASGASAIERRSDEYIEAGRTLGQALSEGLSESVKGVDGALTLNPEGIIESSGEYESAGRSLGEAVAKGLQTAQKDINTALSPDTGSLTGSAGEYEAAGRQLGAAAAAGMEQETATSGSAGNVLSDSAIQSIKGQMTAMQAAGRLQAQRYVNALNAAKGSAGTAGRGLGTSAKSGVSAYAGSFHSVGYNMASGLAGGINSGASLAIAAAVSMAARSLAEAKKELDIHSPSRKFQDDVGKQVGKGFAFGIKDSASLAGKAAKKMSSKVYTNATSWLSKYKKSHKVSLEEEKWYWEQVAKHTKSGTTAYNNAMKKIQNITISQMKATGLSDSVASKVAGNFGVSKTTGSGKKKKKKNTETYYSEVYSAAEKYLSNQQALSDWSLKQELAYWEAVKGQLKSGTQAWYDATKQINSVKADMAAAQKEALEAQANVQKDILDKYKVYYKVSARAEMDYWNIARKQFKAGTDERIEADQKYLEAQQEWYDQRKELDEDYAESQKDINDKLADSVKELQDTYKDAVASRKKDILSSMDLFDAWDAEGYTGETLLYNLKTQVAGLAMWEQQLEELGKKGLASDLMEELKEMGPDAAANIYSLNQMTAAQLKEYNKLWQQKNELAQSQAVKDNESLRQETNSEIAKLRVDAQAELNMLNADYRAALQELNTGIDQSLRDLVNKAGKVGEDAVSGLIGGLKKASDSVDTYKSTTKIVSQVSSGLSTLPQEGKVIGTNTLDGIIKGMTDYDKIQKASKDVIQSIKRAMEEEAEIHSPARLFRRETGAQIPAGVAEGMKDGTEKAVKSSQEMMRDTLVAAQEEMKKQQEALRAKAALLDSSGLVRLNRLTENPQLQTPVVNVDNSGMLSAMQQMMSGMREMVEEIKGLQVIMDTGVLVGELQPGISQESAAATVRRNRGRL